MSITLGKHGKKKLVLGDFPGGPVVGTLCFYWGVQLPSLVGELGFCMPHDTIKQNKTELGYSKSRN